MGVASGWKEVYRFPPTTYPYILLLYVLFCSIPPFCSLKKMFFIYIYTYTKTELYRSQFANQRKLVPAHFALKIIVVHVYITSKTSISNKKLLDLQLQEIPHRAIYIKNAKSF